jgi:hypothetical protein
MRRSALLSVLLSGVVGLGLLVLVWAASAGPVRMLDATSGRRASTPTQLPSSTPSTAAATGVPSARDLTRDVHPSIDLSWIGELLGYAAVLAACFGAYLVLRALWRNRWHPPQRPVAVTFDPLTPEAMAEVLEEDSQARLDAVETGGPRDGIVACWLRLEQSVAACGVRPMPAETSTELITRVLRSLDVDPRAAATLARLYREARFSEHVLGEDSREQARGALRTLHADLARPEAVR